jgi:hypothetical protein
VHNLLQFNQALLGKWLWRYATEWDALLRKLVATKYENQRGEWCSTEVGGTYGVGVWKHIFEGGGRILRVMCGMI